jgi:hypothetical protein
MKRCKLLFALAGATVLLSAAATTAPARNLRLSHFFWRATFREARFAGIFGTSVCEITLEGSFHTETIAKVVGSLIGYIDIARAGPCAQGAATILTETLPWHTRYSGFSGRLPAITSFNTNVIGLSYRIREPGGVTCLARSTSAEPVTLNYVSNTGLLTEAVIGGSIRTGGECFGATGSFTGGSNSLTNVFGSRITITLI